MRPALVRRARETVTRRREEAAEAFARSLAEVRLREQAAHSEETSARTAHQDRLRALRDPALLNPPLRGVVVARTAAAVETARSAAAEARTRVDQAEDRRNRARAALARSLALERAVAERLSPSAAGR